METPEQLREIRRFETLVAALQKQVQTAVTEEEGLQGYKSAARLYNRYVEKMDSLLPPNLQGLSETIDVPDLDPDDDDELKTFLSELLFNLGQLQCLIHSATGSRVEDVHGKAGSRYRHYTVGHCPPHGHGGHQVHVETRVHRGPRSRAHSMPPVPPVPPMPPMPPMPPIPIVSPMPGVPQEVLKAWHSWGQELRDVHREWLQGLGQVYRDWYGHLGQSWSGTGTEEAAGEKETGEEVHQRRREILAMVESKEITVEEAMARLEALRAPEARGGEPEKAGQP